MKYLKKIILFFFFLIPVITVAQDDSASAKKDTTMHLQGKIDTSIIKLDTTKKKHSPRLAAIRSAIIPGWGQIYNKKIWKVPIVYTAIGIPTYMFIHNKKWYDKTKYAYAVASSPNPSQDSIDKVDKRLKIFVERQQATTLVNYRNELRRNMDYSILFFLLFWSLNIVDATVDAHLRDFDVSPDLSLKLKPVLNNNNYGVGLVLTFK
ncbi:MAG TPA: DUF5683 domain-containing protein [Chitinophagaceae bacterium]|nr:DUF5683 domain-containing protein [Chitinophagaceae bacterium]